MWDGATVHAALRLLHTWFSHSERIVKALIDKKKLNLRQRFGALAWGRSESFAVKEIFCVTGQIFVDPGGSSKVKIIYLLGTHGPNISCLAAMTAIASPDRHHLPQ
jgi:hypothetical protein